MEGGEQTHLRSGGHAWRYDSTLALAIEAHWRDRWAGQGADEVPNPSGALGPGFATVAGKPSLTVLHTMPYAKPGAMHVGLAAGFVATDAYARYKRMSGHQVLQALAIDAFGLPAELNALSSGEPPDVYTDRNAAAIRSQLDILGIGFDPRRELLTTDPEYCRWTQTVFLHFYDSWFDEDAGRARPISELVAEFDAGHRGIPGRGDVEWCSLTQGERNAVLDCHRLAYRADQPVNWCPALGRVLADSEIAEDGSSMAGGHEVVLAQMSQWIVRMSVYARRLVEDLDELDWPENIKNAQRGWIGLQNATAWELSLAGSEATLTAVAAGDAAVDEFTSVVVNAADRTIDAIIPPTWSSNVPPACRADTAAFTDPAEALGALRAPLSSLGLEVNGRGERRAFIGLFAVNPGSGCLMPVFAVSTAFAGMPMGARLSDDGGREETSLPQGFDQRVTRQPGEPVYTSKLRDWVFTRQRYWGDPVPMVHSDAGRPHPVPEHSLPVRTPDLESWALPSSLAGPLPAAPLAANRGWSTTPAGQRDPNVMTQWIGSCLCHLRMLDPGESSQLVTEEVARYWFTNSGGVDFYVNGHSHAVGHLLYLRFVHKVLFDLEVVPTPEPVRQLVDLGRVLADGPRRPGAMSTKRDNAVYPVEASKRHGADALRVYLMWAGKLGTERIWSDDGLAAAGRLLGRVWRLVIDERTGLVRTSGDEVDSALDASVRDAAERIAEALAAVRLSVGVSELARLVKELTRVAASDGGLPQSVASDLVQLVAPFAPHLAEELWSRLGHDQSVFRSGFPYGD